MPLSFQSLSHGTVAFGFFNIDSDMLLLENRFFFATDFCGAVTALAQHNGPEAFSTGIEAFLIADLADVGDLMGAIRGVRLTGFIGAVYRLFPFPSDPEAFRQKPEGVVLQKKMRELIKDFSAPIRLGIEAGVQADSISLETFKFSRDGFCELVNYVWQGGYPRWRDGERPDYVQAMKDAIHSGSSRFFEQMVLEEDR